MPPMKRRPSTLPLALPRALPLAPPSTLAAALALVPVLALAGCGGGTDAAKASGTPTSGASVSISGADGAGTPSVVGTPTFVPQGRIKIASTLPAGFPKADVPLLGADVADVAASSTGEPGSGYTWSVVMQSDGAVDDLARTAGDLLRHAGFTAGAKTDAGRLQVRRYTDDRYQVGVSVVGTDAGSSVTYLVLKK